MPKSNMNKIKYVSASAIVCMAAVFVIAFANQNRTPQTGRLEQEPPLVRTMVVTEAPLGQKYMYSGQVRGRYESNLAFQVGGKIIGRHVELGAQVLKGQLLMQIDPKDIDQFVNSQSAIVSSAKSQLHLAGEELKRYRSLFEQDVISRNQLDRYQASYEIALAGYRNAKALLVQSANKRDYCSLYADRPGVVSSIGAETGQVVAAGQPVLTLVRDGDREVEIYVSENRLHDLHNASRIHVTFWALQDVLVSGKIREIAPMADAVTRTYKVRLSLLNQSQKIKLGMTASVMIEDGKKDSKIYIPLSALYQTKDIPCVWVLQKDTLQRRSIITGDFGNDGIQVLEGLKTGERVVTAGVHKLREGMKVKLLGGIKS